MATVELPTEVSGEKTAFDRFAGACARIVSRAPFFAFCVLLIVVWAPTFVIMKFDTWQLLINTATTIITFLMVALLQNTQTRNDQATQQAQIVMHYYVRRYMPHFDATHNPVTLDFSAWPNPFHDELHIVQGGGEGETSAELSLTDMAGKRIYIVSGDVLPGRIDLGFLSRGVYIVEYRRGDQAGGTVPAALKRNCCPSSA